MVGILHYLNAPQIVTQGSKKESKHGLWKMVKGSWTVKNIMLNIYVLSQYKTLKIRQITKVYGKIGATLKHFKEISTFNFQN